MILGKAFVFASLLLLAASFGAQAKDVREELVDRLIEPADLQETSQTYMTEYAKEFLRSWKSTLQPMDTTTEVALLKEFSRRLATDDLVLLPKLRQLYLQFFTQIELQAMADFYDSPVGQSIKTKTKLFDKEVAKIYYPGINDKAIKHWYDSVQYLRDAGSKL